MGLPMNEIEFADFFHCNSIKVKPDDGLKCKKVTRYNRACQNDIVWFLLVEFNFVFVWMFAYFLCVEKSLVLGPKTKDLMKMIWPENSLTLTTGWPHEKTNGFKSCDLVGHPSDPPTRKDFIEILANSKDLGY